MGTETDFYVGEITENGKKRKLAVVSRKRYSLCIARVYKSCAEVTLPSRRIFTHSYAARIYPKIFTAQLSKVFFCFGQQTPEVSSVVPFLFRVFQFVPLKRQMANQNAAV
jgi:hypothetical protein